jgi:hypothetical protein
MRKKIANLTTHLQQCPAKVKEPLSCFKKGATESGVEEQSMLVNHISLLPVIRWLLSLHHPNHHQYLTDTMVIMRTWVPITCTIPCCRLKKKCADRMAR